MLSTESLRILRFADFPESDQPPSIRIKHPSGTAPSPNAFSRTPLFGARERKRVLLAADEEIVVVDDPDGFQVLLAGGLKSRIPGPYGSQGQTVSSRFDQNDYTVFLGLLLYVHGVLGRSVVFEPYRFVKSLGLADSETNVRTVFASLARLAETRLAIRWPLAATPGHYDYVVGRLVSSVSYNSFTQKYSVTLDSKIASLFKPARFSSVTWKHRIAIEGALARWLHAELSSHTSGRFRWTHKLQEAFGSNGSRAVFKTRLKKAAAEVARVTGWELSFEANQLNSHEKLTVKKL